MTYEGLHSEHEAYTRVQNLISEIEKEASTVEPLLSSHKLWTPLLLENHLVNGLGGRGRHLEHAHSKVG